MELPNLSITETSVTITTETMYYHDTVANFAIDAGVSAPIVPTGYVNIFYAPNVVYNYNTSTRSDPQELPWTEGDTIIANIDTTIAAKTARENPSPTYDEVLSDGYDSAVIEGDRRIGLAEANPSIGINLSEKRRFNTNAKRNNKAKKKTNTISDADDHLFDHIDLINDAVDQRFDALEATSTIAEIDAIVADLANDIHWPTWTPI